MANIHESHIDNIVFRADGSALRGGGHIYRCLTLADTLANAARPKGVNAAAARPAQIWFICRQEHGHLADLIRQRGYQLLFLAADCPLDPAEDARACRKLLYQISKNHGPIHWLVVDHYQLAAEWEKQLHPLCQHLAVIDDLANRPHHCDLLLDQSFARQSADYLALVSDHPCTLLTGCSYALVRQQFVDLRPLAQQQRANTRQISQVLIAVSATDPDDITSDILALLPALLTAVPASSQWQFKVVLTAQALHLAKVQQLIAASPLNIELLVNVTDMAQLMLASDIAIAAAGTSMLERCCLGLPSVVLCIVDNQAHIAEAIKHSHSAIAVLEKSQLDQLVACLVQFCQALPTEVSSPADNLYQQLSQQCFALCDGLGSERVYQQLAAITDQDATAATRKRCYLQAVATGHQDLLLQWQLAPKTRQFARDPQPPTPEQHQQWFNRIITNDRVEFYLIKRAEQNCGYIRLDQTTVGDIVGLEISIALAPDCYGQGLGQQALLCCAQLYPDQHLLAYIRPENQASLKAFTKAGFLPLNKQGYFHQPPLLPARR